MEIMEIVSKVVGLLTVKRVQEIAIWERDTDMLYLDGTKENLNWGCNWRKMQELEDTLASILSCSGYDARYSGHDVSWDSVHVCLSSNSEIAKQYPEYTNVVEDDDEAYVGDWYFHR